MEVFRRFGASEWDRLRSQFQAEAQSALAFNPPSEGEHATHRL